MFFVQMVFIPIIFVLEGPVEVEAMPLSADEGVDLEIKCSHSNAIGNIKYFCKDPCNDMDVLITSKREDSNDKYHIRDTGNTFYVIITDLTLDDSGKYWCGVDRVGIDTYNYVAVTVTPKRVEESQSRDSWQNKDSNERLLYVGLGLAALLLILLTAVIIFFKHRHRDISRSTDDVTRTELCKHTQKPSQDTTSWSSANHKQDPNLSTSEYNRGITHKPTSDVYANVQTNGVFYSSVTFKSRVNSEPSVSRSVPDSTIYSQVTT